MLKQSYDIKRMSLYIWGGKVRGFTCSYSAGGWGVAKMSYTILKVTVSS
jgi:hypothetical protein